MDPLEILREDLEDDSVEVQLEAIRNLSVIALTLGPEKSRTKLIQMLETYCFPVEVEAVRSAETYSNIKSLGAKEEVLREIAVALNGDMLPYFGGPETCSTILSLLQKLAMVEETVIREAAVNSILSCAEHLDGSLVDSKVAPLVVALSEAEWWTSRVSAASCGPRLYGFLKSQQSKEKLVDFVTKLSRDDMPMVRQEAYIAIPSMLKPMALENVMNLLAFIGPVLKNLSKELQENMRHRIVDIVKELLEITNNHDLRDGDKLMDICKDFLNNVIKDGNWRVRKRFLDKLIELANSTNAGFLNAHILPGFCRRLGDAEPTVRVKAIQLLPEFLGHKNTNQDNVKELITLEIIRTLVKDEFPEVREATSGSLLSLFECRIPVADAVKEEIVDFLSSFQVDESGEVRLNFCKSIRKAIEILGEPLFVKSILPMVLKLQEDTKWRVRCGVIENITVLAKLIKKEELDRDMEKIILGPFKDPVCAVRNSAIAQIPELIESMGQKWVHETIFNEIVKTQIQTKSKYLLRIVPIRIGEKIATHLNLAQGNSLLQDAAVKMMCKGCTDTISNVRLVSAQALLKYMASCDISSFLEDIQKALEPMANDRDDDVKFFGLQALSRANAR